jgi:hypothetical protein
MGATGCRGTLSCYIEGGYSWYGDPSQKYQEGHKSIDIRLSVVNCLTERRFFTMLGETRT